MRICNVARGQLIGVSAIALLILNLPVPALATTEQSAGPATAPLNAATPPAAAVPVSPAEKAKAEAGAKPEPVVAAKPKPLPPTLVARVNLTAQTMTVQAGGKTLHTWKVSTGAPGYATPPGTFKPGWMAKMWNSRQYDDAPMPYSVFFNGGIAVHGTMNPGSLGRAASHGCVRLATSNAATFFSLVNRHGMAQTRIVVHGDQPFSRNVAIAARTQNQRQKFAAPPIGRQPTAWVYANSAPRAGIRAPAGAYDTYRYVQSPAQRRITTTRVTNPYWSRN